MSPAGGRHDSSVHLRPCYSLSGRAKSRRAARSQTAGRRLAPPERHNAPPLPDATHRPRQEHPTTAHTHPVHLQRCRITTVAAVQPAPILRVAGDLAKCCPAFCGLRVTLGGFYSRVVRPALYSECSRFRLLLTARQLAFWLLQQPMRTGDRMSKDVVHDSID